MITIYLQGGLGNQLFQYVFGRALSIASETPLKLDLSFFREQTRRKFQLDKFNICADTLLSEKFDPRLIWFKRTSLRYITQVLPDFLKPVILEKDICEYDQNIFKRKRQTLYIGYWQSYKYFNDIEMLVRAELTPKGISNNSQRLLAEISSTPCPVSLHIRRGDYVTHPETADFHGVCSSEYYQKAIERIAAQTAAPHFYVFSDDPIWAMQNLQIGYPTTFIENKWVGSDYEDLWLMAHCQHHIIANSSFSWWGAWLCNYSKKIVVAPQQWFRSIASNNHDRIPPDWIQIN